MLYIFTVYRYIESKFKTMVLMKIQTTKENDLTAINNNNNNNNNDNNKLQNEDIFDIVDSMQLLLKQYPLILISITNIQNIIMGGIHILERVTKLTHYRRYSWICGEAGIYIVVVVYY